MKQSPHQVIQHSLHEAHRALETLLVNQAALDTIATTGQLLAETLQRGGRIFSCGNGGSMCDAMHFAEELSGRYRRDRPGLPALAISDVGHLSCVANDYGYAQVFSRYVTAHGKPGDVLLAISTSGASQNTIAAAMAARLNGLQVIALTGRANTPLGQCADLDICTPGGVFADRTQELHIKVIHILIELIERQLFPDNYETIQDA